MFYITTPLPYTNPIIIYSANSVSYANNFNDVTSGDLP